MSIRRGALIALVICLMCAGAAEARTVKGGEVKLPAARMAKLQARWVDQIRSRYPRGRGAPMRFDPSTRDLKLMGLPRKRVLLAHRYKRPTAVYPNGKLVRLRARKHTATAAATPLVSFAGAGFFGIRPGAWLLFISD